MAPFLRPLFEVWERNTYMSLLLKHLLQEGHETKEGKRMWLQNLFRGFRGHSWAASINGACCRRPGEAQAWTCCILWEIKQKHTGVAAILMQNKKGYRYLVSFKYNISWILWDFQHLFTPFTPPFLPYFSHHLSYPSQSSVFFFYRPESTFWAVCRSVHVGLPTRACSTMGHSLQEKRLSLPHHWLSRAVSEAWELMRLECELFCSCAATPAAMSTALSSPPSGSYSLSVPSSMMVPGSSRRRCDPVIWMPVFAQL